MNSSGLVESYWEADLAIPDTDQARDDLRDAGDDFAEELEYRCGGWAGTRINDLVDRIDLASPVEVDEMRAAATLRVITAEGCMYHGVD